MTGHPDTEFKRCAPGGFNVGLIGSTCTALPHPVPPATLAAACTVSPSTHGLNLLHFPASCEQYLWDTLGGSRCLSDNETTQVGLRDGRLEASYTRPLFGST